MKPWALALTFIGGLMLTFLLTIAIDGIGPSAVWVWALWFCAAIWVYQLPQLPGPGPRAAACLLYGGPFVTLWLWSNPTPVDGVKVAIRDILIALFLVVGAAAGYGAAAASKLPKARPVLQAVAFLFPLCWLIATFSSSTGAGSHMVYWLTHWGIGQDAAETITMSGRKSIHFLFYGTIGLLALITARRGGAGARSAVLALVFVLLHASFDEIRQSSYADRTGSFWDVMLDMSGAAVFVWLGSQKASLKRHRIQPPRP